MRTLRLVATIGLVVALLGLMWYQTFAVTGLTVEVVPSGVERPAPPPPPELSELPMDQANIDLFARVHPVWSAFGY